MPNNFRFPIGERLKIRLKDILESEVDEKYYLSEKMINYNLKHKEIHKERGNGFAFKPIEVEDDSIVSCILTKYGSRQTDTYIKDVLVSKEVRTIEAKAERRESDTNSFRDKEIVFEKQDYMNCLQTRLTKDNLIVVKEATKQGYAIAKEGDSINLSNPNSETRRGRVGNQIANTLDTACNQGVVIEQPLFTYRLDNPISTENECFGTLRANAGGKLQGVGIIHESRIRRLTPLECMRLQGYPDDYIKPCSDSQTYKQAGNSITVNVMKAIIKNLIPVL